MRFGLKHLLAFSAVAGITVFAIDRLTTETVTIEFSSPKSLTKPDQQFNPQNCDYSFEYKMLENSESVSGIVMAKFGHNVLLGETIDERRLLNFNKQLVSVRYRKWGLPFLPATTITDRITGHFDDAIIFPDIEEWRSKLNRRR